MKTRQKPIAVKVGFVTVRIYCQSRTVNGTDYPLFQVADYSTGRRRLRSFADKAEATREAERIARGLAAGDVRSAQMRGTDAASYGRAVELLKPTGLSLEVAAAIVAEAIQTLGGNRIIEAARFLADNDPAKLTRRTVAEAVAELVAAREAKGKSGRYIEDLRSRLNRFAKDFAVEIHTVQTAEVQRWLDGLKLSPQTTRNFRTVLGTLFSFAEARGYIARGRNPIAGTEKVSGKNGNAVELFTPEEAGKLLAAASPEFLPALAIGLFAGLRSAEIERLDWRDIDFSAGLIHVAADKAKTASRRLVPIVPALAAWLAPVAKKTGLIWDGSHKGFYDAQQATAEAAGVEWKTNAARHSFVSYRLAAVQNAAQVALEAGNSPGVVFSHYRELVKPVAAERYFSLRPESAPNVFTLPKAS